MSVPPLVYAPSSDSEISEPQENQPEAHNDAGEISVVELDPEWRQRDQFVNSLRERWACATPGHEICVQTPDGEHHRVSEDGIVTWVDFLCRGAATISQPPMEVFIIASDSSDRTSLRATLAVSHGLPNPELPTSVLSTPSRPLRDGTSESGALGPGYRGGQFVEWVGTKVLSFIEQLVLVERTWLHRHRMRRWANMRYTEIKHEELLAMFDDALTMLRPTYSRRVNRYALSIARGMIHTVHFHTLVASGTSKEALKYKQISDCISTLAYVLVYPHARSTRNLAWDLHNILTKFPLSLQDEETSSAFVRAVARELAIDHYSFQHHMLGISLCGFVNDILNSRALMQEELLSIQAMAQRHAQSRETKPELCRSWEIVTFAVCARRHPGFQELVLGPRGIPLLISSLKSLRAAPALSFHGWCTLSDTVSVFEWLLQLDWVNRAAEPALVQLFVEFFRRGIPKPYWHKGTIFLNCLRCIRHIVTQRPDMLNILIQEDALSLLYDILNDIPRRDVVSEATHLITELKMRSSNAIRDNPV